MRVRARVLALALALATLALAGARDVARTDLGRLRRARAVSLGPRVRDARSRSGLFPRRAVPSPEDVRLPWRTSPRPAASAAMGSDNSAPLGEEEDHHETDGIPTTTSLTTDYDELDADYFARRTESKIIDPLDRQLERSPARRTSSRRPCLSRGASRRRRSGRRRRRRRPRRTTRRLGRSGSIAVTRARLESFAGRRRRQKRRARTRRLLSRPRTRLPRRSTNAVTKERGRNSGGSKPRSRRRRRRRRRARGAKTKRRARIFRRRRAVLRGRHRSASAGGRGDSTAALAKAERKRQTRDERRSTTRSRMLNRGST